MKNILEYVKLLVFLVLAFIFFDAIKSNIKEKFFPDDTKVIGINKERIGRAFNSGNDEVSHPTTAQAIENKVDEKTSTNPNNREITLDPNLVGRWYEQSTYTSGSLNTETYLTFFEDGTMMQTTQSHGTLRGYDTESTIINEKIVDPQIQAAMEKGFRWSSQNGRICMVAPNGTIAGCNMSYHFENQYLFIQFDGYKKPHGYTRAN
jgi:hypothetical protein